MLRQLFSSSSCHCPKERESLVTHYISVSFILVTPSVRSCHCSHFCTSQWILLDSCENSYKTKRLIRFVCRLAHRCSAACFPPPLGLRAADHPATDLLPFWIRGAQRDRWKRRLYCRRRFEGARGATKSNSAGGKRARQTSSSTLQYNIQKG